MEKYSDVEKETPEDSEVFPEALQGHKITLRQ